MRITRAALRAQEAEDELHVQVEGKLREQGFSSQSSGDEYSAPLIHEDDDIEVQENYKHSTNTGSGAVEELDSGRQVLRDITGENYPLPDTDVVDLDGGETLESKDFKKSKGRKAKKAGSKKKEVLAETNTGSPNVVEIESSHSLSEPVELSQSRSEASIAFEVSTNCLADEKSKDSEASQIPEPIAQHTNMISTESQAEKVAEHRLDGIEVQDENTPKTPTKPAETMTKTPKFNPDIHLSAKEILPSQLDMTEDSFIESITTRSPSKLSQSLSMSHNQEVNTSPTDQKVIHTPPKSTRQSFSSSPQRIEDSVEAIDALEDAIEQFNEDLPVLEVLPFESPVRSRKISNKPVAPVAARTPAKTPSKAAVKVQTKTPAKSTTKTPSKTPAKAATPKLRTPSIGKTDVKTPQTLREKMASTRRETVKERVKAIESKPVPAPHRRATSVHVLKKDAPEVRQTLKSKHMATKSVPVVTQPANSSMSFSNSPLKHDANPLKKRVPSGGVLVTSKPGFVPAKSTKATTTSSFALPGEAIAARLKAQREERTKKEEAEVEKKTFKARPAPVRTARPSVMPRENKASVARLSIRQASGENKENVAPSRSIASAGPAKVATTSATRTTTIATANSSVRRTTIAPKPTSTIESRKTIASTSASGPISAQASQRISSLTSGQQISMSKTEVMQQKVKSKEAYERIKSTLQQQEEERKLKEEAAKKARAEAAERGRQASREWAEKQKRKMAITTKPAKAVEATG